MILDGLRLENETIVITHTYDLLKDCYLENCEIVLRHPTSILMTLILNAKNEPENLPKPSEATAFIMGCVFDNCTIPDAHYDGCYFQSSNQKVIE